MIPKSISIALTLFIANISIAQSQNLEKIIGRVGNNIILSSDINVLYEQELKNNAYERQITKCKIMYESMVQQLLVAQAARDSVIVTNQELESALDERINYFIGMAGSKESLEKQTGKTVYQIKEEQRSFFRDRLTSEAMQRQIVGNVKVTPFEVQKFFESLPMDSLPVIPASVSVAEIIFKPKASQEMEDYAKEKLDGIRKDIVEKGKSFSTMAGIYGMDQSKDVGGDFYMEKEQTDPLFFTAAMKLQPGEISQVFRSKFGYHIVQMVKKYSNTSAKVKHIIIIPELTQADYERVQLLADSVYKLLEDKKITFNEAVMKYSDDEYAKLTGGYIMSPSRSASLAMTDLDPYTATNVTKMKVGDFSKPHLHTNPMTNARSIRIISLRDQVEPHRLNMKDDYALIQQQALSVKQADYLKNYIQKIVPNYYIQLDEEFKGCSEFSSWVPYTKR